MDNLSVFFLAECEQSAAEVMARLTAFINGAQQTLDFAIYDMRFTDQLRTQLKAALDEKAQAGVEIRFCYDADKPLQPDLAAAARLCTEFGRVAEGTRLAELLSEVSKILNASGLVVWVWNPSVSALTAALAHGYSERVLAHLPSVARSSCNASEKPRLGMNGNGWAGSMASGVKSGKMLWRK